MAFSSVACISGGKPAGANSPYQFSISTSG
jgi:hypothetical protein